MTEETITYNVVYNVQNIDQSIRQTQRYLYFANAVRLSITDLQQVMAGPTLANVMWTSVQLTRVWTNLYRIINATNKAQQTSMLSGVLGGRGVGRTAGATARQFAVGQTFFGAGGGLVQSSQLSLWQMLVGYATTTAFTVGAFAVPVGGLVGAALLVGGAMVYDIHQTRRYNDWKQRQREIARNQGLEF